MSEPGERHQRGGPLQGLKVVELGGIGPGPFATMTLADMGANVVRIDRPGGVRQFPGTPRQDLLNRGKRSIALDLKSPADLETTLQLIDQADVLVEGFRPGVAERLGLGPEVCIGRNSRLVYGRMTGWGQAGPLAHEVGHDIGYVSVTGALHAIGNREGGPVVPLNLVGDFGGGGMYLVAGVLAALHHVSAGGAGQVVDAAIVDGAAHLLTGTHAMLASGTWVDERGANVLDGAAPYYGVYETSDHEYMSVGAVEPQFYAALLAGLELDDDPRLQDDRTRWPTLRERIARVFSTRTRAEWVDLFEGTDACVVPVVSLMDAAKHPHVEARQTLIEHGGHLQAAPAPRFSTTQTSLGELPPLPGEHSSAIRAELSQTLHYRAEEGPGPHRSRGFGSRGAMSPDETMVVLRSVLERNAIERPDEVFVSFEDGSAWTRAEGLAQAYASGNALRTLDVQRGDRVALFLPNGKDFLRAWWGAAVIGATIVPINIAYRGELLDHLLALSSPRLTVVAPQFVDQLTSSECGARVARVLPHELNLENRTAPEIGEPIELWDPHVLLLTSGTTGPSKLAEISYQASYTGGSWIFDGFEATPDDLVLLDLPLFHAGAMYQMSSGLSRRMRFAVRTAPDLKRYWEVARETGATLGTLVSSMVPYLLSQSATEAERNHSLRGLTIAPLPADLQAFTERFGVSDIVTGYGSTEQTISIARGPGEALVDGYCGRVREGFEVRIVDEFDLEVPAGQVGEAIVRHNLPWHLMSGYVNNPEAQSEVNRNGWFHTGDLMRCDEEGHFFFVDRGKDSLRRRGENISSFEVEVAVNSFPGVAESACVAYRAPELVDDEVKVWVVPVPGQELDCDRLFLHCVEQLPAFMVPQFFEVVDEIPKTPSARPQKYLLRERGNSAATWDRTARGYSLTRRGLERIPTASLGAVLLGPE